MQQFIEKYSGQITGVLSGFDRLVFRGSLRRLYYGWWDAKLGAVVAKGMEVSLAEQDLFKDHGEHFKRVSERLKKAALQAFEEARRPVIFLRSPSVNKDEVARKVAL